METQNTNQEGTQKNQQQQPVQEPATTSEQPAGQQNVQQEAPQPQQQQPTGGSNDIEENKAVTYLSYLGLLFLVPMLVKKDSPFAQFHSKQGLVLTIAWFIGSFLYPLFGLGVLVHIALLVLSIMGLVNVSKGEMKDLPIVGDLAKKFNI